MLSSIEFTGVQVNYFFVCRRKLWFFSRGLEMEHESDLVRLGKTLHEGHYARYRKEVSIGRIKVDFIGRGGELHEVKYSRKIEKAHIFQLLYYLYVFQRLGLKVRGVINYPLLKKTTVVQLNEESLAELEQALREIKRITSSATPPPPEKRTACRKCSYSELCWC